MEINNYCNNKEDIYVEILKSIGYLDKSMPSEIGLQVALLFIDNPHVAYHPDELADGFKTSRPTVYRHINKLLKIGIIERCDRNSYIMRYSDFGKAWNYSKNHINTIMEIITEKIEEAKDTAQNPRSHIIREVKCDGQGRDRYMDIPSERDDRRGGQDDIQSRTLQKTTVG
jgi:predicted transcriptional regulator